MISEIVIVFALYWIVISLYAYNTVTKTFKKYRKAPQLDVPEQWQGFIRKDFNKWDQTKIIRGCFTKIPVRLAVMGTYLFFMGLTATIKKYLYFPKFLCELNRKVFGNFACHYCLNIIEEFDINEEIMTPVVISNHVNWLDLVYLGSCFRIVSYVSKKEVTEVPVINAIAEYGNALYVDRGSPQGRHKIKQEIKNRVQQFLMNPKDTYPLMIYPEGTVSNGRSILEFKNGAFESLCPITVYSLRYECKEFNMGMDEVTTAELSFISMSLNPTLIVKRQVITPLPKQTVEEYRQRCRRKCAQMGGFKLFDANFKDIQNYELQKKELRKSQKKEGQ